MSYEDIKVVWVFGLSAAGKKTFIYDLCNPNTDITPYKEFLGDDFYRKVKIPIVIPTKELNEDRLDIIKKVLSIDVKDSIFLVHGQGVDISRGILDSLNSINNNIVKECIYLKTDKKRYVRNIKERNKRVDGILYKETLCAKIKQKGLDKLHESFLDRLGNHFDDITIIDL